MKNLSSALGELKSNLEITDRHNQTNTSQKFQSTSSEVRDLRDEIHGLKLAFKNMVDLMLEEIDELKNDITYQSSELKSIQEASTSDILGKIEIIQIKQDQKDSKCDELIGQAEYVNNELGKKFELLEEITSAAISNFKKNSDEINHNFYNIIQIHQTQLDTVTSQNGKIEEFMSDVVTSIQNHQKKITDLGEKCFTVEANAKLQESELREFLIEADKKFDLYKEGTSGDLQNVMNIQRETNKKIEEFANSFTEKEESFEDTVSKKLISFQDGLQKMELARNMMNTETLEKGGLMQELERCVKEGLEDVRSNNAKCGGLERKFDNFRNEMNTLFVEYENTWNERFKENAHALDSLRKTKGKAG